MLADLEDRLGQAVQRGRRQARSVTGPLVLGDRIEEEPSSSPSLTSAALRRCSVMISARPGSRPRAAVVMFALAPGTGTRDSRGLLESATNR